MSDVTNADLSIIRDAGFNSVLAYGYGHTGLPADGAVDPDGGEDRCLLDPEFVGAYAASHPEEDFAETFAVWLTPRSNWRQSFPGRNRPW